VGLEIVSLPDVVLAVDDEPVILEVTASALAMRGLEVVTATTADLALEFLRRRSFGCLLTDKNLPGMNGIELIRETRRLQPHCACMLMTGYSSTDSAIEALRLGATDYLTKPFESLALVAEKVHRAIENQRVQLERDRLFDALRDFQAELKQREDQVSTQRNEIEMFNQILELRVDQATADLRRERDELIARVSGGASRDEAEIIGAEMALHLVKDIQLAGTPEAAPLRGELQRVVRQLEMHIHTLWQAMKTRT
jgi:FixJ family two-component response regulator